MKTSIPLVKRAYIAGFLDGDGSIYVRAKPNSDYRYKFQIAPSVVLFQSAKDRDKFKEICDLINLGYIRERNDGILEYTINKIENIKEFLYLVRPFVLLKRKQVELTLKIIEQKQKVENENDFRALLELIDSFRDLNYSKKRKKRTLTP